MRELWVCGAGAFVALKALAFRSRGENKDAYDLMYILSHHGEGPQSVADAFEPLSADPVAQEALRILQRDFTATNSVGTMRAAAFLGREWDDALLADVAGLTREFLRIVAREQGLGPS